ncbi:Clp protease N-terminal domain-containing protein [Mycolicibacterium vinylchloridicum]|uniref:Clp protease N-terminal domain-containing protein n=1 Tax=Mycolicibacterium vinylchloridicum TaxID=2736928 RepID=UPI0015CBC7D6|nr:Clp protease N-terminal domain-containing protein [Mycolicibacterium vinylchloridicum]
MSIGRLADALRSLDGDGRRVVTVAHDEAYRYIGGFLSSAHLLLGLLAVNPSAVTAPVSDDFRAPETIRCQLELYLGPARFPARPIHLAYTPHARGILIRAAALASHDGPAGVTTPEHLWSALKAATGSLAARCLAAVHLLG